MSGNGFWEKCWQAEDQEQLFQYLKQYDRWAGPEIDVFRQAGIHTVCDAACGFGAYTLALASQGFAVRSFDISAKAVEIARNGLRRLGYDIEIKVADLLRTGYGDGAFDGAFAHSVMDHMTRADAEAALHELYRIVRPGGLILLSFDTAEEEDYTAPHDVLPDGSLRYTGDSHRSGMIFHPYDWEKIHELVKGREIVFESVNRKNEQIVILKK